MDIIAIIAGLLSDAPEAIDLWNKIQPLIGKKWFVPQAKLDEIAAAAPAAQAAVVRAQTMKLNR